MRNWLIGLGLFIASAGCNQNNASLATANLLAVDDVSLLCVESDSSRLYIERGRPLSECAESGYTDRHLIALATQRETGEVAVLDASPCGFPSANAQAPCTATLVDVERTQPGLNFLPVGAEPVGIVSTPGGTASFVAVAEPGKAGIFGLPSACIGVRKHGTGDEAQAVRDIRTWPACRLPVAPATIAMFRDSMRKDARCGSTASSDAVLEGRECPADLGVEERNGRLKLAVTLPELGQLWTFDAQEILDRDPGSYAECLPESRVIFETARPAELSQPLPADLSSEAKVYSLPQGSFVSTPTDIASDINASHGTMYVADRTAPIIHQLDTRDACNVTEAGALYPLSYTEPNAVVGTRKVALSPVIDSGKRYVYAVEESDRETSGSVMVFDVSPNAEQLTPLVLPQSPWVPDQAPDRVSVGSEVSDVEFLFRDSQVVDEDGVTSSGVRCEPSPEEDDSAGALFRPSTSGGAAPLELRGLFAVASLQNGQLAVIDVDDYDAACRRPSAIRRADDPTLGCATDEQELAGLDVEELNDSSLTRVTDEQSCNVVQPHRIRTRSLYTRGVGAPRLRAFPRLRSKEGTSLLVDQSAKGLEHPRMLAPFAQSGQLLVGTTLYTSDGEDAAKLEVDPRSNETSNLLLPLEQPRSYSKHTGLGAITYEGILGSAGQARVNFVDSDDYDRKDVAGLADSKVYGVLDAGPGALLCSLGLEDQVVVAERAEALQATSGAAGSALPADEYRSRFASYYGDYVEVLEPLLADTHDYWDGAGKACGEKYRGDGVDGRRACELTFGLLAEGQSERDFRIVRAFDDELVVEPRAYGSDKERTALLELLDCCFPDAAWFVPRASHHWVYREASTLSHRIEVGESGECRRTQESHRDKLDFRAFELSCSGRECDGVGRTSETEVPVCVLDAVTDGSLAAAPPGCVYDGLTAQFVVYRGGEPSSRDMEFSWVISGGFAPFLIPMTSFGNGKQTIPQRLRFVPQVGRLAVTDGGAPSGRDNRPMGFVLLGFENAAGAGDITYSAVNYYYY